MSTTTTAAPAAKDSASSSRPTPLRMPKRANLSARPLSPEARADLEKG